MMKRSIREIESLDCFPTLAQTARNIAYSPNVRMWTLCCGNLQSKHVTIEKHLTTENDRVFLFAQCDEGHHVAKSWAKFATDLLLWPDRLDGPAEIHYDGEGNVCREYFSYDYIELPQFRERVLDLGEEALLSYIKPRTVSFKKTAASVYLGMNPDSKVARVLLACSAL